MKLKVFIISLLLVGVVVYWHNVDKTITAEDEIYISKILKECNIEPLSDIRTYDEEIHFLQKVQDSIILIYKYGEGIPLNSEREPKDLFEKKEGLCFDRSRVIEKICISMGFETRHVFLILDTLEQKSNIGIFFRSENVITHAVSEIKTQKGWLAVGSNFPWIALDTNNLPLTVKDIKTNSLINKENLTTYKSISPVAMWYHPNIRYIYGLYSRHGRFYPPFTFIPDFNLYELTYNFKI